MLSGALRQLFALAEAYPDLKANANFQQLQSELADLENKIAAARRFFNNAVQEYNSGDPAVPGGPVCRRPSALPAASSSMSANERKVLAEAPRVSF